MVSGFVHIFLYWLDFFLCFDKAVRKVQCFIALSRSWENFGHVWPSYKSSNSVLCYFGLLHVYYSKAKQCFGSSSARFQPCKKCSAVIYSVLQWMQLAIASFSSTVIIWELVCFSTWKRPWDQGVQSPGRDGTPSTSLWYVCYKEEHFEAIQACHSLIFMYCSWNKYCLCYLFGCGLRTRIPESQKAFQLFLLCLYNASVNFSVTSLYVKYCLSNKYFLSSLLGCGLRLWCPESQEEFHTEKFYILEL